jgi:hypothetical protein
LIIAVLLCNWLNFVTVSIITLKKYTIDMNECCCFTSIGSLFDFYSISKFDSAKIVELFGILDGDATWNVSFSKFLKSYCFLGMDLMSNMFQKYQCLIESLNGRLLLDYPEVMAEYVSFEAINFLLLFMSLRKSNYLEFLFWLCTNGKCVNCDRMEFLNIAPLFNKLNTKTSMFGSMKINTDFILNGNFQILKFEHFKLFDLKFGGIISSSFEFMQKLICESTLGKSAWLRLSEQISTTISRVTNIFPMVDSIQKPYAVFSLSTSLEKRNRKLLRRIVRLLKTMRFVVKSNTDDVSCVSTLSRFVFSAIPLKQKVHPDSVSDKRYVLVEEAEKKYDVFARRVNTAKKLHDLNQ